MKQILEWFAEISLIFVNFPSNIVKPFILFDTVNKDGNQKYPVILIERWFSRNVFHIAAKKYLESKGFVVYSLNYPMMKGSFEDSAVNLKNFVEKHSLEDVILIGISAGATTSLEYLQFHDGWKHTHLFISIGGALYGSPLAVFFPFSKSLRELNPKSKFIKHLHSEPIKHLDRIITMRAKKDNMVPASCAHLPGARNITVNVVGHNLLHTFWLPTYKKVYTIAKAKF